MPSHCCVGIIHFAAIYPTLPPQPQQAEKVRPSCTCCWPHIARRHVRRTHTGKHALTRFPSCRVEASGLFLASRAHARSFRSFDALPEIRIREGLNVIQCEIAGGTECIDTNTGRTLEHRAPCGAGCVRCALLQPDYGFQREPPYLFGRPLRILGARPCPARQERCSRPHVHLKGFDECFTMDRPNH